MRRRCADTCSGAIRLNSTISRRIAAINGAAGGVAARRRRSFASSASKSPQPTSFLVGKYRKNVRRPIPAALAMSSIVVRSNPCRSNRSNATCSSFARDVTSRGTECHNTRVDTMTDDDDDVLVDDVLVDDLLVAEVSIDG